MTTNTSTYLCLKSATAPKLGGRADGSIRYLVLADVARKQIYLSIAANDGGGYFSRELVPFAAVERCMPTDRDPPFSAKIFASCFVSRSSNNAGFLAAILRNEGRGRNAGFWPVY